MVVHTYFGYIDKSKLASVCKFRENKYCYFIHRRKHEALLNILVKSDFI